MISEQKMKRRKWIRVIVFAVCYFVLMMVYPFIMGEEIRNLPAWGIIWGVTSLVVAVILEHITTKLQKSKGS